MIYRTTGPSFSWLGTKTNGVFNQVTGFHSCRETFTYEIHRRLKLTGQSDDPKFDRSNMTLRSTNIAIKFTCDKGTPLEKFDKFVAKTDSTMKEAIRILNIFERYMGWGLSRVYRVSDAHEVTVSKKLRDLRVSMYVTTGSPKWFRAPQLLSLYLYLIRISTMYEATSVFNQITDLKVLYKKLITFKKYEGKNSSDAARLYHIAPHLKLMIDNRVELFFKRKLIDNYRESDSHYGISNLLQYKKADRYTKKCWKTILSSAKEG